MLGSFDGDTLEHEIGFEFDLELGVEPQFCSRKIVLLRRWISASFSLILSAWSRMVADELALNASKSNFNRFEVSFAALTCFSNFSRFFNSALWNRSLSSVAFLSRAFSAASLSLTSLFALFVSSVSSDFALLRFPLDAAVGGTRVTVVDGAVDGAIDGISLEVPLE
jgi:hypothetical protein